MQIAIANEVLQPSSWARFIGEDWTAGACACAGLPNDDVLAFYMLTGGVAKYVELLVQNKIFSLPAIIDHVFTENSLFLRKVKTCW